jgi:hypothetical protein
MSDNLSSFGGNLAASRDFANEREVVGSESHFQIRERNYPLKEKKEKKE